MPLRIGASGALLVAMVGCSDAVPLRALARAAWPRARDFGPAAGDRWRRGRGCEDERMVSTAKPRPCGPGRRRFARRAGAALLRGSRLHRRRDQGHAALWSIREREPSVAQAASSPENSWTLGSKSTSASTRTSSPATRPSCWPPAVACSTR